MELEEKKKKLKPKVARQIPLVYSMRELCFLPAEFGNSESLFCIHCHLGGLQCGVGTRWVGSEISPWHTLLLAIIVPLDS